MKRKYDRENSGLNSEKARIIVAVIPVVLIVIILAVTFIVKGAGGKKDNTDSQDIQQSIIDYSDENAGGGNSEEASGTIQKEKEETPSGEVQKELQTPSPSPSVQPSATPYKAVMEADKVNYDKVKFDKDAQLKEMMAYWADNNQKALDDLANLERFIAMSWKLRGTEESYYFGEKDGSGQPSGKGVAVYADNQYYYGDWKNGVRSGNGTWIHYHMHNEENKTDLYKYHQYTGSWVNDLPDGEGSEHYDYVTENLKANTGYNNNLIGIYKEGLVSGKFYITNIYNDGNVKEWSAEAKEGSWTYQNDNKDTKGRRTIQVDNTDPDNYIWMYPKENIGIGVSCLISKNKN